jgi:hypothetical protein
VNSYVKRGEGGKRVVREKTYQFVDGSIASREKFRYSCLQLDL